MTWPESVDEALCFGWIDGIRRRIDDSRYSVRFSRRRAKGIWSELNVKNAKRLISLGRMRPAGLERFRGRLKSRSGVYSFEQDSVEFDPPTRRRFMASARAWSRFRAQPRSYQKRMTWWVTSALLPQTRLRRLLRLIESSLKGGRLFD
ncbi:MAG: YdeI/OmpD-associated family protein [Opitutaceae bacterium]